MFQLKMFLTHDPSGDEHCIAVTVKPEPAGYRFLIGFKHKLTAGKSGNQHEKCRFRQVKIGEQGIDNVETISGVDKNICLSTPLNNTPVLLC